MDDTARITALEVTMAERDRRYGERFDAQERANSLALDAAEKAVLKAEGAAEKRFEAVNEFRATLTDQAATFATRVEMISELRAMSARLERIESHDALTAGRGTGMSQLWGFIVGASGLVVGIVMVVAAVKGHP
jgi:hypothetical protein